MSDVSAERLFLDHLVKSVLTEPDGVELHTVRGRRGKTLEMTVGDADFDLLTSDNGELKGAIEAAFDACAWKRHAKVRLTIDLEEDDEEGDDDDSDDGDSDDDDSDDGDSDDGDSGDDDGDSDDGEDETAQD